ncbi:four helix bundle protein [Flavobacterium fontis]|uniref:Four helix bundle protein n=1 Tax=Flavobacterium fontis TaxID=1124188 RepID=A0A1M4YAM6_9FLAO|nr:four helix bundle protein [Flavobacterium fontis]SHF02673.1 four helix bundle protein [Flavobacterium fontis]
MNSIKSHKDLHIWRKGMDITEAIFRLVKSFPKEEKDILTNQMKRCALSIPSNIAEGFGRNSNRSFIYFLAIARGSLYELETQLLLAERFHYIKDVQLLHTVLLQIQEEGKMINAFSKTLH